MTPLFTLTMFGLVASDVTHRMNAEPKNVEELYAMYNRYGLWLPPKGTQLVRWEEKRVSMYSDGEMKQQTELHLGLLVRAKSETTAGLIRWFGYDLKQHRDSRLKVVKPTVAALQGKVNLYSPDLLELAVSAHHLGWSEVAEECFKRLQRTVGDIRHFGFSVDDDETSHLQTVLRNLAWQYHYRALTEVKSDRVYTSLMLKRIYDDDNRFREEFIRELLTDLKKTLDVRKRERGMERWIDELCELRTSFHEAVQEADTPNAYDQLCAAGFDAVPALIEHLGDTRRTRSRRFHEFNLSGWTEVASVGSICDSILQELSAGEVQAEDETTLEGRIKLAKQWFERAKKVGEERWLTENVIGNESPREGILRVLAAKYPKRFLAMLRESFKGRWYHCKTYLTALTHAKLSRTDKLIYLVEACNHPNPSLVYEALSILKPYDRATFSSCLARHLDRPMSPERMTDWEIHSEHEIQLLVVANDPKCWDAITRNLHRLRPVTRITLISKLFNDESYPALHQDNMRLRLLDLLGEDTRLRYYEDTKKLGFQHAFYEYPQIAVRDAVTLAVADYLDIDIPWKPDRSPAEWDALRKKVQAAFAEAKRTR